MNKKTIIITGSVIALAGLGGIGAYALARDDSSPQSTASVTSPKSVTPKSKVSSPKTRVNPQSPAATKPSTKGSYVTLAEYQAKPGDYQDSKKVYFFHAPWCHICQGIEKEINADPGRIPDGVTLIKTDFDSQRDLRKKYGVTVQTTFVQVDNSGNETSQWSAADLDGAISQIKT